MQTKGNFLLLEKSEFRDWLKKQNVARTINKLQVHHTYSPNYSTRKMKNGIAQQDYFQCLEGMRNHHVNTNKWSATGQNITLFEDGKIAISLDRNLNSTPAGIKNVNTGAICVEIIGNFDIGGDIVTKLQKESIVHLYACLCEKFNINPNINTIVYHSWFTSEGVLLSDYDPKRSAKSCPGTNFLGYGNTKVAANKSLIPWIQSELKKLKGDDSPMTQNEQKAFEELKQQVQSLSQLLEQVNPPIWFVKEFGEEFINKTFSNPKMTSEGWRSVAIALRAVGVKKNK